MSSWLPALGRRLVVAGVVLWVVSLIVFALLYVSPGERRKPGRHRQLRLMRSGQSCHLNHALNPSNAYEGLVAVAMS